MRTLLLLLCALFVLVSCQSQADVQEQLKQEAQRQAQQQVDQAVDKAKEEANKAKDSFFGSIGQTIAGWGKAIQDWWGRIWGSEPNPKPNPQPNPNPNPQPNNSTYVVNSNGARGRDCPKLTCNIITTFKAGQEIQVSGTKEGDLYGTSTTWLIVLYKDSTVFVHSSLASAKDSSPAPQEPGPIAGDEFIYPVDRSKKDWDNAYDGHTPLDRNQPCYQLPYRQLWHAGYDIGFNSFKGEDGQWTNNTPVYAVADGAVRYSSKPTGKTDKDGKPIYGGTTGYPGGVVIIEHIHADGTPLYAEYGTAIHSMYAHLDPDKIQVSAGQRVTKGTLLATGLKQQVFTDPKTGAVTLDNTHLHWEMRYFYDGSEIKKSPEYKDACATQPGPGYAYDKDDSMAHPDNFQGIIGKNQDGSLIRKTYHWTNPSVFVDNH